MAPSINDFKDTAEIIDYIQNRTKEFTAGEDIITIDMLLANSQTMQRSATGDVSGVFTSKSMDTGTPGVTWDYTVNYTVSPMPSGTGWYFKSINCTVSAYKGFMFYTWATSGILTFTSATHSLSPSTYPTSLTINMTLEFQIWTSATGANPVTYSEKHSHKTTVNNVYS